jgi:large subunit ribosomal protein L27
MAKGKQGGKTAQGTTRRGKRLGVKIFGGEKVTPGKVIVRQRGTKYHPGDGVGIGRDHTLFATQEGVVQFYQKLGKQYISVQK